MEDNTGLLDPTKTWVPLEGNWDNIPKEIEDLNRVKCVLVIDTKNWHYHIQIKQFGKGYQYPKKRRDIKEYETFRTEWLTLADALERVKQWQESEFAHAIQSDLHPYWLNGIFEYIRLDGQAKGFLWCGTDNKSYCPELLRDKVLFKDEIEAFIDVAKENTQKELDKLDEKENDLVDTDNTESPEKE